MGCQTRARRGRALHRLRRGRRRPDPGGRRLHGDGGPRVGARLRRPAVRSPVAGARAVPDPGDARACRPAPRRRATSATCRQARQRLDGARDADRRRQGDGAGPGARRLPPAAAAPHPRHRRERARRRCARRCTTWWARTRSASTTPRSAATWRASCRGGAVPAGAAVTEQHILDLEREAFLSLCGEPKTRERIQHMLTEEQASSELRSTDHARSRHSLGRPHPDRPRAPRRLQEHPPRRPRRARSVAEALRRAEVEPRDIEDVVLGCAMPEAEQGLNVARQVGFLAGLPDAMPAMTINRFCSSGLQATASSPTASPPARIDAGLAGGLESMSMIPMGGAKVALNPAVVETVPDAYIPMGNTAENVARQFGVSRERAGRVRARQPPEGGRGLARGDFAAEVLPVKTRVFDGEVWRDITVDKRRGAARGHVAGEAGVAQAGLRSDRHRDGRQLVAAQRRRGGRRADGAPTRPRPLGKKPRALLPRLRGRRASRPRSWASARCRPSASCWRRPASRSTRSTSSR